MEIDAVFLSKLLRNLIARHEAFITHSSDEMIDAYSRGCIQSWQLVLDIIEPESLKIDD